MLGAPCSLEAIWKPNAGTSGTPATNQFAVNNLSCGVHPHDGLNLDPALHVWWDEEFANALGELTP